MALLTDFEIKEAIQNKDILIEPFDKRNLQGASYDLKIGKRGIVSKSVTLDQLKGKIQKEEIREIEIDIEKSLTIPGGSFGLVTTLEKIKLSNIHVAHIGMSSYYVRKGLALLSGLQIDPGWEGVLVLGLANLSPRNLTIDYGDDLCTIEIHRLKGNVDKTYCGPYAEQKEGVIPKSDKDYLRTIETMNVSELTRALLELSSNVNNLSKMFNYFWIGIGVVILIAVLGLIFR